MSMMIPVSFKKDEKWLYDLICKQGDKSCYIKDILKMYLKDEKSLPSVPTAAAKEKSSKAMAIDTLLNGFNVPN